MASSALSLTQEEYQLKRLVQEVLVKNKILKSRSEREWNAFATRRLLQDFLKILRPPPPAPVAAARRPASGREQAQKKNGNGARKKAPTTVTLSTKKR